MIRKMNKMAHSLAFPALLPPMVLHIFNLSLCSLWAHSIPLSHFSEVVL